MFSHCQPFFQSYFRNKSFCPQTSVTFSFLSLLTCYPADINPATMGETFFICLKTAFPIIYIFKHFSKHIHASTQLFPKRCALGHTFIEPVMVAVNVFLLREFVNSKPNGIHGEFRLQLFNILSCTFIKTEFHLPLGCPILLYD